jgi:hypothetical protein
LLTPACRPLARAALCAFSPGRDSFALSSSDGRVRLFDTGADGAQKALAGGRPPPQGPEQLAAAGRLLARTRACVAAAAPRVAAADAATRGSAWRGRGASLTLLLRTRRRPRRCPAGSGRLQQQLGDATPACAVGGAASGEQLAQRCSALVWVPAPAAAKVCGPRTRWRTRWRMQPYALVPSVWRCGATWLKKQRTSTVDASRRMMGPLVKVRDS